MAKMALPSKNLRSRISEHPATQIWTSRDFLVQFFISIGVIIFVLHTFAGFAANYVELRHGALINDPILALFQAVDVTWIVFGLIYGALIFGIINLIHHPKRLLLECTPMRS